VTTRRLGSTGTIYGETPPPADHAEAMRRAGLREPTELERAAAAERLAEMKRAAEANPYRGCRAVAAFEAARAALALQAEARATVARERALERARRRNG
jgi:hypothetical protein